VRHFRRGERALVRWPLGAEVDVRAELLNRQGRLVSTLAVQRHSPGVAQVELPVAGLAQADYVLRLSCAGAPDTTAALAFAIVP
jgi:hypothetical protein